MSECSDYSQETIDIANEVFFIIEDHIEDKDLVNKFEYLYNKKYSFGMQRYFDYLLAPEILLASTDLLDQVKKALEMAMMIHVRPSAARDHDFDATLYHLSPKLHKYAGNARNRETLKQWSYSKRQGSMPRILSKLIDSEAKAFIKKWEPLGFEWFKMETWQDWQAFYAYGKQTQ